jgi:prolyl 4-hydroxylase
MAAGNLSRRLQPLIAARRFDDAARLLTTAAASGDAEALVELAQWRIGGSLIRRDLAAARDLLRRAAAKGRSDAALLHAYFLASGTGGADDFASALAELRTLARKSPDAARQVRLIEQMALQPDGAPATLPQPRELSSSPTALAFEGLFSVPECLYLRSRGEPRFQPSVVVDPRTGASIPHPIRMSSGTFFGVFDEDLVVNALNRRIAAASGTAIAQGESLQLLSYGPGNEYRAHMDALPNEPNQRIVTMLVYLTDDYEGGDTCFLKTGLCYKGRVGDALLFRNVTGDGRADPMSEHAGRPVTKGTKVIASRWIRARPFAFPPPPPLLGDRYG